MSENEAGSRQGRQGPETLEWIVGALCGLVVLALLGFLGWEAITDRHGIPILSVSAGRPVAAADRFVVPVEVTNAGESTGADVEIAGRLTGLPGGAEETASTVLDYVPSGSSAAAGLVFRSDPATGTLELRVVSYTRP